MQQCTSNSARRAEILHMVQANSDGRLSSKIYSLEKKLQVNNITWLLASIKNLSGVLWCRSSCAGCLYRQASRVAGFPFRQPALRVLEYRPDLLLSLHIAPDVQ